MGFQRVFLFCTKKNHIIYMEKKKKISSLYRDETTILHGLYGGKLFSKIFCAILKRLKGVSIFVSIPHCPMDYCIPPYSAVVVFFFFFFFFFCFFFFFFFFFFVILLNKALLVIVWNNLESNSVEY